MLGAPTAVATKMFPDTPYVPPGAELHTYTEDILTPVCDSSHAR